MIEKELVEDFRPGIRQKGTSLGFLLISVQLPPSPRLEGVRPLRCSIELLLPRVQRHVAHRTKKRTTRRRSNRKLWENSARPDRLFPDPVKLRAQTASMREGGGAGAFSLVCPTDIASVKVRRKTLHRWRRISVPTWI